jgi:hypothetical protein
MRISIGIGAFFITGLLHAGLIDLNTSGADEPKEPTMAEQLHFKTMRDSLQRHWTLYPQKIDDAIKTLSDSIAIAFDCPETTRVRSVIIKITTRLIKWDKDLLINEKRISPPPDAAGYYIWHPTVIISNGEKHITADNLIMFDSSFTEHQVNTTLRPLAEESMLYHELLHGQLLINAMYEQAWRDKVCGCYFDLGPGDAEHERIPELVHIYLKHLAALDEKVYAIHIPSQFAKDPEGNFEIVLGAARILRNKMRWESYHPYFVIFATPISASR